MKTTSTDQSSSITLETIGSATISSKTIAIANPYTISIDDGYNTKTYNINDLFEKIEKLEKIVGALLSEPSVEKLEQHRALKDAYNKYKMVEALLLGNDET